MKPTHTMAATVDTPPCRSRLAGENPEPAALIQAPRVIVGEKLKHAAFTQAPRP